MNPTNVVQPGMDEGRLRRVDSSLIPRSQVGTDVYQNVRLVRTSIDTIRGDAGSKKIVFAPPNSGLLNLKSFSILGNLTLDSTKSKGSSFPFIPDDGTYWVWDGTGTDPDPAFPNDTVNSITYSTNVGQGLSDPFYMTLIERIMVSSGGTPLFDTRELNLINHMNLKLYWSSGWIVPQTSTYQGYDADNANRIPGVAGEGYWEYIERLNTSATTGLTSLSSVPQDIQIQPFMYENAFFACDGVLPLQIMPNVTIEIWLADSEEVLQQSLPKGYSSPFNNAVITGQVNYFLENIRMECLMAGSASLEKAIISQGMSMTFRDYAHFTNQLTSVTGLQSFQIPVTNRAIEKVWIITRWEQYLRDYKANGKFSSYTGGVKVIQRANIRINGIRRYGEDLDTREALLELHRLEPKTKLSELFQDEMRDWRNNSQILAFSAQMDYSKELISGIKTASQTSPLLVDITWATDWDPSKQPIRMDIFVQFVKWISITREQIEVIE